MEISEASGNAIGSMLYDFLIGTKKTAYGITSGIMAGGASAYQFGANVFDAMDATAEKLSEIGGGEKSEVFGKVARWMSQHAKEGQLLSQEYAAEGYEQPIARGLTQAIGQVPQAVGEVGLASTMGGPMIGMAALEAGKRAHLGLDDAALGALEGGMSGAVLKATAPMTRPAQAAIQGGVGALQEVAKGSDPNQILQRGVVEGAMGLASPSSGPLGLRDLPSMLRAPQEPPRLPAPAEPPAMEGGLVMSLEPPPRPNQGRINELRAEGALGRNAPIPAEIDDDGTLRIVDAGQPASQPRVPREEIASAKYAASINLRRIDDIDAMKGVLHRVARANLNFMGERGGVIDFDGTRQMARELGMTDEQLLNRRQGQAFNHAEVHAARSLLQNAKTDMVKAAERATLENSDRNLAAFDAALARFVGLQEQVSGIATEAGRALAAHKQIVGGKMSQLQASMLEDLIDSRGGKLQLAERAREVLRLEKRGQAPQAAKLAREALTPGMTDKLHFLFMNFILSGPRTHVRNIVGNSVMTLGDVMFERPLAAVIGQIRGNQDAVTFSEAAANAKGLVDGLADGMAYLKAEMEDGPQVFAPDPTQGQKYGVDVTRNPLGTGPLARAGGAATNMLRIEDNFFKKVLYAKEIHSEAAHMDPTKRAAFLADPKNTDPEAFVRAVDATKYGTFQSKLGDFGTGLMLMRKAPFMRYLVPFVQTPINILKRTAERTPYGFVKAAKSYAAGEGRQGDIDAARATFGTLVAGLVVAISAGEEVPTITGSGPRNPQEFALWRDDFQPGSVRIGDTQISMQGLDPWALTLTTAADIGRLMKEGVISPEDPEYVEVVSKIGEAFAKNFWDKSFVDTLNDVIAAGSGRGSLGQVFERFAGAVIPNVIASEAQKGDPTLRRVDSPWEAIKARIPGMSRELPAVKDVWGRDIKREGALGPDDVSPFFLQTGKPDPTNTELRRLGVKVGFLGRSINGHKLDSNLYNEYVEDARGSAKVALDRMISGPGWDRLTDERKTEFIDKALDQARLAARRNMMLKHRELGKKAK